MKLKMGSQLGGTNYLHWSNPWERDTTRGAFESSPFPSMHSSEIAATVSIATCQCCGVQFGFMELGEPKEFCPSHRWLGEFKPLGRLFLTDIKYPDPYNSQVAVTGRCIRYSYFLPEEDSEEKDKLFLALRVWLVEEYLEKVRSVEWLPKVTVIEKGVLVTDIQHLQHQEEGKSTAGISSEALKRLMQKMDEVYVDAL